MSHESSRRGMTLVEVLVACAITAVLIGGLGVAIYSIITVTERGNAESGALQDVQKAAYWISNDAQMTWTTGLLDGGPAVDNVTLNWSDGDGDSHSSSYWLSGTKLQRNYDGNVTTAAWYVTSVEFTISGDVLAFRVESTLPGRWQMSRQTTGNVYLRAKTGG
ncbi:MAG: prepilin-type N-terminal cleavage/methylation domain-containing protein [Chloroflexota bacterium]